MSIVYDDETLDTMRFARRAREAFAENAEGNTFTEEDIGPSVLFAVRWDNTGKAVLVFRISKDCKPTVYAEI